MVDLVNSRGLNLFYNYLNYYYKYYFSTEIRVLKGIDYSNFISITVVNKGGLYY